MKNKVIAITGAGSGIGKATALHLAGQNAMLVLGARTLERLKGLEAEIRERNGEVACVRTDVTSATILPGLCERLASDTAGSMSWSAMPALARSHLSMSCASRNGSR